MCLHYAGTDACVLRKLCQLKVVNERVAEHALRDLALLRMSSVPYADIATRMWELRHNLSAYDAAYVAVAELFDVNLLTFDHRLRHSVGPLCTFIDP